MKWTIAGALGALGVTLLVSILPVHHSTQPVGNAGVILLVTAAVVKLTHRTIGK